VLALASPDGNVAAKWSPSSRRLRRGSPARQADADHQVQREQHLLVFGSERRSDRRRQPVRSRSSPELGHTKNAAKELLGNGKGASAITDLMHEEGPGANCRGNLSDSR
jgi:hypothetical protein